MVRESFDYPSTNIIVSNHGGRQLDGAPSSIRILPEIVEAVGGKTEIYLDGGIRSGQDVLKLWRLEQNQPLLADPFYMDWVQAVRRV